MHVINSKNKRINPFDLMDEDFDIEVIAKTLSRICRFWSQTDIFYSVAQHCLIMDQYFQQHYQGDYDKNLLSKMSLIHEVFEGMTGLDIPTPYKHLFPEYIKSEKIAIQKISKIYNIPYPFPEEFKEIDKAIMVTEANAYLHNNDYWQNIADPLPVVLPTKFISHKEIEVNFINRWEILFEIQKK
ncbi:hypothetical protein GJV85_03625 [Sulfurimonas aquatica]|uniref:HD family hydrolase n=1 Tax=Sulfurimonas aquatica TaxID=2672570 RepID=A0A975AZ34_9BACT|nr:hypothetical protein [Sulfurimonas aquatica]QSZ41239.1 hypothetical protein GJV85_03625 [Sulfurimonas aquatica]